MGRSCLWACCICIAIATWLVDGCKRDSAGDTTDAAVGPVAVGASSRPPAASLNSGRSPAIPNALPAAPLATPPTIAGAVPAWHPLQNAIAGEWVEYDTLDGRRLRYDVLQVQPDAVATRVTLRESDHRWGQPTVREDARDRDPLAADAAKHEGCVRTARTDKTEAAGRTWNATLFEDRWTDEEVAYVRRTWVSGSVPFEGVVRMELYGGDRLEARMLLHAMSKP